ncbi:cobalamin biosynthesis protein CbiX [Nocardioides sp. zg-1228]|uniref:cobalamin biosynthesis protein CbiX n=1 Tax=Nocardioides sp. zg-1228 TaxID=2763008 RepID=UPI001642AEBC|nr:cobalamin biosynthesis protein CbiX [Nocardioides sp. zg-1228]MBC2933075.1 cobalamin biosynthesis protein CbiX [Nocardioides sp. zg-1228]QSF56735.1 hypothetical protein JX575_14130 [Nocardioides sp. zg-1228]
MREMSSVMSGRTRTVLVAGHESDGGAALAPIADTLGAVVTTSGRPLHDVVTALLTEGEGRVVVVPMTWGRDPVMVADTAKTLRWISATAGAGRVAQSADFGTVDHLVAWLRRAAERVSTRPGTTLVVTAPSGDPFDDADLHRVAHLARTHGAGVPVEVACVAEPGDLAEVVRRARLLGADRVVVVPAGFARTPPAGLPEDASFFGPLLSEEAVLEVIRRRVAAAEHDLRHGHDGIAAGLLADHGHGYAHSHAFEHGGEGDSHGHSHGHSDGATHRHSHPPSPPDLEAVGAAGSLPRG